MEKAIIRTSLFFTAYRHDCRTESMTAVAVQPARRFNSYGSTRVRPHYEQSSTLARRCWTYR